MDDGDGFLRGLPPGGGGGAAGEAIGGDLADEANVVVGSEEIEGGDLRAANLGVGEDAVPQHEPPGSPPLPVIRPLVQHSSHRRLRRRRRCRIALC